MVGNPGISERTRSKKLSHLVNQKIKSPKKVETTSIASSGAAKGTKKKSRKTNESDIAVIPSSSPKPETDHDVKYIGEVEIDQESGKVKRKGEKNRATKKGFDKNEASEIIEPEAKPEKKRKVSEVSWQKGEGKKEEKKKRKKVEEEDVLRLGEQEIGEITQRSERKEEDKKSRGKEVVKAKSLEKSKKGNIEGEGKNGNKKKKVEGEKEKIGKKRNEGEKEDENMKKKKQMNETSVKQLNKGDKKEKTDKKRDECEKEDEKIKKKKKKQKTEVEEAKKQMNVPKKRRDEGDKKEKKQENKKQKTKVKVVEGKKDDKKVQKKKNSEEEIESEEENDKNNNLLYKFPMARVTRIIKSEDRNVQIAQGAAFVINKATEKFLELFCREVYALAFLDQKNHVAYNHLSSVVSKRRRFDFLSDFVPEKVKAEDALAEMSKAETEMET